MILRTSRTRSLLVVTLLTLAATPLHAYDRSMRCGTYLILAGGGKESAMTYEVLKKCGEPVSRTGDTWIYTQGSVTRVLTFNYEGRLYTIESRR